MTAKTRARTDSGVSGPGFSGSVPLRVLRWALLAWLFLEFFMLLSRDADDRAEALAFAVVMMVSIGIAILATARPPLAAVASLAPMASTYLIGHQAQDVPAFLAVPLAVCATGSVRAVILTMTLFLGHAVVKGIALDNAVHFASYAVFALGSAAAGLVVRMLRRRTQSVGAHIRQIEAKAEELRATERTKLADELSELLSGGLSEQRRRVAAARADDDPAGAARTIEEAAQAAREALGRLRGLVSTLRGHASGGGVIAPEPGLVAVAEDVDELLTGHGLVVELDTSGMLRPSGDFAARLLSDVLREATAVAVEAAPPGVAVRIAVASGAQGSSVEIDLPGVVFPATDGLARARRRCRLSGGSLETGEPGLLRATVPAQPTVGDAGDEVSEADHLPRWNRARTLRWTGSVLALAGVLVYGAHTLAAIPEGGGAWVDPALWAWTFTALVVTCWRPAWAIAPLVLVCFLALWLLEPRLAFAAPHLALVTLTAMLVARNTVWSVGMLALAGLFSVIWFRRPEPLALYLSLLIMVFGTAARLGAQHFHRLALHHRATFGRAVAQRRRARDDVRRELAGELHDIVAHQLTLITLQGGAAQDLRDPGALEAALERVDATLQSTQTDLALLLHVLKEPGSHGEATAGVGGETDALLTPLGAAEAAAMTLRESGRVLMVTADPAVDEADPTTRRTVTRIIREATTNILRYAPEQAHCTLELRADGATVNLSVTSPLPLSTTPYEHSTGLGLVGLEERVRLTGGALTARSVDGMWVVTATLPLVLAPRSA
ncbi:sensor histidine kinase [Tessaracoccus caeni]|uniref:sensor histidine kinase n=1 Tax=Tessaracoccus caeni TaxID=3031239 RepID=UPI0023DC3789|nr:histidine kinase [Tessaracoccus caeni]MDF1487177.1 histidine kinase [Tessaracoccus caeni]